MPTQNLCRYFKFGHCKFADNCSLLHVKEVCETLSCAVWSCNLRHPRACKYFQEYNRCKFSDYCSYIHKEQRKQINPVDKVSNKEIMEKLDNLTEIMKEKENIIIQLVEKVRVLEEKLISREEKVNENVNKTVNEPEHETEDETANVIMIETQIETTENNDAFFNHSVGILCEKCDFKAKSKSGLQVHIRAKHKVEISIKPTEQINTETNVVCESDSDNCLKCNECEFVTQNKGDLNTRLASKHIVKKVKTKQQNKKPWKCPICNLQFETNDQSVIHSGICNYGTLRQRNQLYPRSPTMLPPHFPRSPQFSPHRFPHRFPPRFPRGQIFL